MTAAETDGPDPRASPCEGGRDGAGVSEDTGMKLNFCKSIVVFTAQARSFRKALEDLPRQLSEEFSVKVPAASGSHFPLNSWARKDEMTGDGDKALPKPLPAGVAPAILPGIWGWATHSGKVRSAGSQPQ